MDSMSFEMYPIGQVCRNDGGVHLQIFEAYRPALQELDKFSHVMVFWWADRHDNENSRGILTTKPPYAGEVECGVFATRAEYRPNPIAMTTCKILGVDEVQGIVRVGDIDAFDETAIVDLKAYFPVCDRVEAFSVPEWVSDWPEWMPEEGLGL